MDTLYIESAIRDHPRVARISSRYPSAEKIECERYGEVFNPSGQNFRIQKQNPALIVAEKHGRAVIPTPLGYTIGADHDFYFSHLLNCLYDCRYCFLQGMFRSANYVHFVNYEHFEQGIDEARRDSPGTTCFFSGYDCDSLALEKLTGFVAHFLPFFRDRPDAWLELRTKSISVRPLLKEEPIPNVIVAYTLSPTPIAEAVENGAPPVAKRLERLAALAEAGWQVGLRLDPLIPWPGFADLYSDFIESLFEIVSPSAIHSVTTGPMRFPKSMHDRIVKLYPRDPLFALAEMTLREGQMSYPADVEETLVSEIVGKLAEYLPAQKIFRQG
ncbi:MAG: spore photoproduct lyase family protein [Verrucomicrobiota bacterium]